VRAAAAANDACLACHSDRSLRAERRGRSVSLHVDPAVLGRSVHGGVDCADCHAGFRADRLPHASPVRPVDCLACHGDVKEAHPFHASLFDRAVSGSVGPAAPAVACTGCHGTHDIAPPKPPGPAQEAALCGRCHAAVAQDFAASAHGRAAASGVAGAPTCLLCHRQAIVPAGKRPGVPPDGRQAAQKIAQEKLCLSCHLKRSETRTRTSPTTSFIAAFENSVHGRALQAGNGAAANCVDCHGAHRMRKGFDPAATVYKGHIPETCGACHVEEAAAYAGSVHGEALRAGNSDAPVCTNCHGEHDILNPHDPRSPVAPANVSAQVCSPCHSSVRLAAKYGIRSDRFRTFSSSYHGLAIRGGDVAVANCASCHGFHDVRRPDDPKSSIHKANLASTCGKCHPGSDARFASGKIHVEATAGDEPILYWVAAIYAVLIAVVIGGMFLHNLADFVRKSLDLIRARRGLAPAPVRRHGTGLYLRMTPGERVQHLALVTSFSLLVVTGFMLHYPDAFWVKALRRLSDHLFDTRSRLHRAAGIVMILASLYHVAYLALTVRGRRLVRDLFPKLADATGALRNVGHNLGLVRARPRFGRFSYVEKAEYWALVWGTIVMACTGLILWFEEPAIRFISKLGWDVARLVHFYEAWLATLAILVWHVYFVVFNPEVYPMNLSWITGNLTEEEMEAEHPLELEEIQAAEEATLRAAEEERRAAEAAKAKPPAGNPGG
jgi:formate dehydrogenase gamma subunit